MYLTHLQNISSKVAEYTFFLSTHGTLSGIYHMLQGTKKKKKPIHSCIPIHNIRKRIEKTVLFTIASKRIKYLKINFTKEMKNLNTEN